MSNSAFDRPALLGGPAVRPAGPPHWPVRDPDTDRALSELAISGDWGRYHGPWCGRLIAALAAELNARHVLLCCSGTAAVELALRGLGIQPGDEVLLAGYDFKTNFTNVLHLGAKPVLVDVRRDDAQLDVSQLEAARSERTRCVIASHLHGGLVDMAALRAWAEPQRIAILEDACQATGASVGGRPSATGGDVGVLSFGGSKLLTAGRGGAIVTQRDDLAQRIRLIAHRGNDAYPLSEMQAALLWPQLGRLHERHRQRAAAVRTLTPQLKHFGLTPLYRTARNGHCATSGGREALVRESVDSPTVSDDPAFYKLGLFYDSTAFEGLSRDHFAAAMRAEGIAIDAGFPALHRTHARSRFRAAGELPQATTAAAQIVTLHHPVLLGGPDELAEIVTALTKVQRCAEELRAGAADCALPDNSM